MKIYIYIFENVRKLFHNRSNQLIILGRQKEILGAIQQNKTQKINLISKEDYWTNKEMSTTSCSESASDTSKAHWCSLLLLLLVLILIKLILH